MSEVFESELRTALANGARALPVDGVVARLETVDYRSRRRQPWIFPVSALTGTALAATAVTVVLLSSRPPAPEVRPAIAIGGPHVQAAAYVGWTAIPTKASAASATSARAACGRMMGVRVTASDVLLDDVRGPFVEIIYNSTSDGRVWSCISKNGHARLSGTVATTANPRPDRYEITRPVYGAGLARTNTSVHTRLTLKQATERSTRARKMILDEIPLSPNSLVTTSGVAGRDVTGVVLILKGGERIRATVQHGWYAAWWPGSREHPVYAIPVAAEVLTTSGPRTINLRR
jgi:hypothetical protein